jgi:hypothetical protein
MHSWHHARVATKKTNKPAAKKQTTKKSAPKKAAPKKAAPKKAATNNAAPQKKSASKVVPRRADYGAPVDGFFAKQAAQLRSILEALRILVGEVAPEATASLKWGMPFYAIDGEMVCALAGFKAHVNLILPGAPDTFDDPEGLLEGDGKTGRHLKLRSLEELPRKAVRGWLKTTARAARERA